MSDVVRYLHSRERVLGRDGSPPPPRPTLAAPDVRLDGMRRHLGRLGLAVIDVNYLADLSNTAGYCEPGEHDVQIEAAVAAIELVEAVIE